MDHALSPGCTFDTTIPIQSFNQITVDGGNVILSPIGDQSKPMSKGSTASLAQVVASQKVGESAYVRLVVQQRVLIQAVASGAEGTQRAQTAMLNDRWVYYTRAGAVEQAAADASASTPAPEVAAALSNCLDAGKEVLTLMQHLSQLCQQLLEAGGAEGPQEDLQAAAAEEWDTLLRWARNVECPDGSTAASDGRQQLAGAEVEGTDSSTQQRQQGSQAHALKVAMRVSYAPFAAAATPLLLGISKVEAAGRRRRAMEATDAGNRLEEAAQYLQQLKDKLSARLALARL